MCENPLRALPKMDVLLSHPILLAARARIPYTLIRQAARDKLEELRRAVPAGAAVPSVDDLAGEIAAAAQALCRPGLKRVINATGVVLHTNLGRAPLAPQAAAAVRETAEGYRLQPPQDETGYPFGFLYIDFTLEGDTITAIRIYNGLDG